MAGSLINSKTPLAQIKRYALALSLLWTAFFAIDWAAAELFAVPDFLSHGILWLLGLAVIGWGAHTINERAQGRLAAEEALRLSEERFSIFMSHLPAAVFIKDHEDRLLFANQYCQALFGWQDCVGKTTLDLLPKEVAEPMAAADREVLARGPRKVIETVRDGQGVRRTFETYKFPLLMADNTVLLGGIAVDITERVKAERSLQEAHDHLAATLRAIPDLFFEVDSEGFICDYRAPMEAELYTPPKEFIGKSIQQVLPEKAANIIRQAFDQAARQGQNHGATYALDMPDGQHWYELSVAIKGQIGSPAAHFIATVRDISERVRAEQALRESEERYRHLIESSHDWVWEVDRNGVYTYASSHVKKLLGYAPEEIVGKTPFDLMPADEATRVGAIFAAIAAQRRPFWRLENTNRHKDGHLVVLETNGVPFFDAKGDLLGYRGMDQDITERKRAEETLKRSEERYRVFVANSSDGIFRYEIEQPVLPSLPDEEQLELLTQHGYLAECNDAFARMHGATNAEELIGVRLGDLIPPSDPCRGKCLGTFVRSGYRIADVEIVKVDGHGNTLCVAISAMGFLEDGHLVRIWGVQRDVSERKRAEEDRERLVHQLRDALAEVKTLSGLLPICMNCKKIRDDQGYWTGVESYITRHTNVLFSHGICPDCAKKLHSEFL